MRTIETRVRVILLTVGIFLLLSGCALSPPRQLAAEDLARIRQEPPITVVVYQPPPPFHQSTRFQNAMGIMGGPVGYLVGYSQTTAAGAQTRGMLKLVDPSIRVRDQFVAGITSEFGLPQPTMRDYIDSHDIERLRAALGPGVVLEFKTLNWEIFSETANPFAQDLFGFTYMGRARLIRLGEQKILWESMCGIVPVPRDKATVHELQQNDGALLKRWLIEAADKCAKELIAKFSARSKP